MSYIETVPPEQAESSLKTLYDEAEGSVGYIPNYLKIFSHRPEVYKAWQQLNTGIRVNMSLRRYELVTLAAARKLQSTYCMIAHASTLLNKQEMDADQLMAIANDYGDANLSEAEVAIMAFAEKVIASSCSITQSDVDHLKSFNLTDAEILDIVLAASARSFFSKVLDALNAEPDAKYMNLAAPLRAVLAVGRSFGG